MTDLLLLKHDPESSTGTTIDWCHERTHSYEVHASQQYFAKEHPREFKALIVFGGDMEAWETEKYPWLLKEKKLIAEFIEKKKPVFGICLGSQLLAEQLGGQVTPLGEWEFGWYPVRLSNGEELMPLHCHSSKFSLPPGATRTAFDRFDVNQGFTANAQLRGFQFHTEIDERRIEHIFAGLNTNPPKGRVQTKAELLAGFEAYAAKLKAWYFTELDQWWASALSRPNSY